ncbi:MAG TPA: hypothetical protein VFN13_00720 [Rudaea sp.]|nr:hypothetical protein [Rudaea sp.]
MNRILPVRSIVLIALAALAVGGCSMFHQRDNYYSKASETRPLEVPPDLDTPATTDALVVPEVGASDSSGASGAVGSAPPAVVLGNAKLHVSDTVENTWKRVGLALERANVGKIDARDETAHTYTLAVSGLRAMPTAQPAAEHHWYSRILHPFGGGKQAQSANSSPVSGTLNVTISADGDGAQVDVQGAAGTDSSEAARRVLQVLRDRMG